MPGVVLSLGFAWDCGFCAIDGDGGGGGACCRPLLAVYCFGVCCVCVAGLVTFPNSTATFFRRL